MKTIISPYMQFRVRRIDGGTWVNVPHQGWKKILCTLNFNFHVWAIDLELVLQCTTKTKVALP